MKRAIIGILSKVAVSKSSHSWGMNEIVSRLFEADIIDDTVDWNQYDELIIYHGVNHNPKYFNVFGGMNDEVLFRAKKLNEYRGKIYSLDGFQFNRFSVKRRIGLYDNYEDLEIIKIPERKNIVIGDSHSISVWPNEDYTISCNNAKTLFGFLNQQQDLSNYEHAILYFGNIDVRFHLCRQDDPIQSTKDLFNRYCEYASKYNSTLTELLPIEHESRIIPNQGKYLGENFFGSINERKEVRMIANEIMQNSGIPMITWPKEFVDELGNLKFSVMERKRSVHLSPYFYLRNIIDNKEDKQQLTLF